MGSCSVVKGECSNEDPVAIIFVCTRDAKFVLHLGTIYKAAMKNCQSARGNPS